MSKSNIKQSELSGGMLKYIRHFSLTVSDQGTGSDNIDFSGYSFEDGRSTISHINIINTGTTNPVYFAFDAAGETITTASNATYNGKVNADQGIELDGIASSAGFRCGAGLSTTIEVWAW